MWLPLFLLITSQDCGVLAVEPKSSEWQKPAERKLFPIYGGADGKIGLIDAKGRIVTVPRYGRVAESFQEGLLAVGDPDAYLDEGGREKFRAPGILGGSFSEGLAAVKAGDRFGYIDKSGTLQIPAQFQAAGEFRQGLAAVRLQGKHGFIDTKGRVVIEAQFRWADAFEDGAAAVDHCGSCGYIDPRGKALFEQRFRRCFRFAKNGIAKVQLHSGSWAFVTKSGKTFGETDWDGGLFSEGLAAVRVHGRGVGFVNTAGEWTIAPQFAAALPFSEGLAAVNIDGRWGFVDKAGTVVIAPQFGGPENPDAAAFHNGLAYMADAQSGKYGFVDRSGKWIIPPLFERCQEQDGYACGFHSALARVETKTQLRYIDRKGRNVWSRPLSK